MTNKIELKKMTVKINDDFQDKLIELEGKELTNIEIIKKIREINKWLISQLSGLTIEQIENLEVEVYDELQNQAGVITNINKVFDQMKLNLQEEEINEKKKS